MVGDPRPAGGPRVREVKQWVRLATAAPEEAAVVVSELSCSEPGCPPYEVVMAVLVGAEPPRQKKLHRRLAELTREEVVRLWQDGGEHHHHEQEPARALPDVPGSRGSEKE